MAPGSTFYSDVWAAYNISELGYKHYVVVHKHSFKAEYKDKETDKFRLEKDIVRTYISQRLTINNNEYLK